MATAAAELQTRSQRIAAAIQLEIERVKDDLDSDEFLRTVSFSVKLHTGTGHVRAVILNRESERSG